MLPILRETAGRQFSDAEVEAIHRTTLAAYRWQYITSGVQDARFLGILFADDHSRSGRAYQYGAGADRRQQHELTAGALAPGISVPQRRRSSSDYL